ncbi:MAG: site-specific DNA-methyltransferase [Elusimicrobiota bacterium]
MSIIPDFNRVIQGDVYESLRALPSDVFAGGVADPPYGTNLKGVDWDSVPDYGPWIEEAYRVLRPGGTIYVFGSPTIIAEHWHRFPKPKDLLVWLVSNRTLPKLEWWQPSWDAIVAFSKSKPRFFRDQVREEYSEKYRALLGKPRAATQGRYGKEDSTYEDHGGTLPRSVLIAPSLIGRCAAERVGHPTQKPIELISRLIESVTLPGEPILDLFAGAGTSSVAAARLGRKWLAIERDPGYCEMITKRIAQINAASPDEKIRFDFDATSKRSFDTSSEAP